MLRRGIDDMNDLPKLYTELADWWTLLTAPEDYAEGAEFFRKTIGSACEREPRTLLELGSGGGNNASHMKRHFEMTLVDLSPRMLEVSRRLNPECEHIEGDMRTIRLDRRFDVVFIHDAIAYMQSAEDLRSAIITAYEHCKPGGVALFAPDYTTETFRPSTSHGGHDGENRSLRYLEWTWDPDPNDTTFVSLLVYVMREGDRPVRCAEDYHLVGLFSNDHLRRVIEGVGFRFRSVPFEHSEVEAGACDVFLGVKPRDSS
jgi:SAM-dependent methyltransferase